MLFGLAGVTCGCSKFSRISSREKSPVLMLISCDMIVNSKSKKFSALSWETAIVTLTTGKSVRVEKKVSKPLFAIVRKTPSSLLKTEAARDH